MNTYTCNPCGIDYSIINASMIALYGKPGGLLIPGRENFDDPAFVAARAAGALIVPYRDPAEVPDPGKFAGPKDQAYYTMSTGGTAHLWPYPTYGARINYPGTHLADIRAGSPWANEVIAKAQADLLSGKFDGQYWDILGGMLWPNGLSNWPNWPQWEKDLWTQGCIDLVRRLDQLCRQFNPRYLIINNNYWDRGDQMGFEGEQYVTGISMEHPEFNAWHIAYAARKFGGIGRPRSLLVFARTGDVQSWQGVDGPQWITNQQTKDYLGVLTPCLPFTRLDYTRQP